MYWRVLHHMLCRGTVPSFRGTPLTVGLCLPPRSNPCRTVKPQLAYIAFSATTHALLPLSARTEQQPASTAGGNDSRPATPEAPLF